MIFLLGVPPIYDTFTCCFYLCRPLVFFYKDVVNNKFWCYKKKYSQTSALSSTNELWFGAPLGFETIVNVNNNWFFRVLVFHMRVGMVNTIKLYIILFSFIFLLPTRPRCKYYDCKAIIIYNIFVPIWIQSNWDNNT